MASTQEMEGERETRKRKKMKEKKKKLKHLAAAADGGKQRLEAETVDSEGEEAVEAAVENNEDLVQSDASDEDDGSDGEAAAEDDEEEEQSLEAKKQRLVRSVSSGSSGIMTMEPFSSLELSEPTMKAIKDMGFENMTQVYDLLSCGLVACGLLVVWAM